MLLTDQPRKNEPAGITHARDRLLVDSTDVDKTGRREDPTTRPRARRSSRIRKTPRDRDAPRHRLGRLHVLVRRSATRPDRYRSINELLGLVIDMAPACGGAFCPPRHDPAKPIGSSDLDFRARRQGTVPVDRSRWRAPQARIARHHVRSDRLLRRRRRTGTWRRSRCRRTAARSPSLRTKQALACCGSMTPRRASRSRGRTCRSATCGASCGTKTRATWPSRSTARKARATSTRSTCATTSSRAGPRQGSPDSTRRGFAVRRRSNGKASTAARSPASTHPPAGALHRQAAGHHQHPRRPGRPGPAGFIGRHNYFLNELGVAVIYPNVRGSTGYGKTFLELDNGMKREDSVKDIGALLDWIAHAARPRRRARDGRPAAATAAT